MQNEERDFGQTAFLPIPNLSLKTCKMKKSSFILLVGALFIDISAIAQTSQSSPVKQHALTVSPYQALTKKGELQFGYERQHSRKFALELNLGFRFKGTDDPRIAPYNHEQLDTTNYLTVHDGITWFLLIPIPSNGRDEDWEEKTVKKEYYTNRHAFLTMGYKCYLVQSKNTKVAGGLYLTPGFTLGSKNASEYVYSKGRRGDMTELGSDYDVSGLPFLFGFTGEEKLMQEDVYSFDRLEIKKASKTYLVPHMKLGYQLPIGQYFSADFGLSAGIQAPFAKGTEVFSLEPSLKLGAWF
jgi:hypothetical protein